MTFETTNGSLSVSNPQGWVTEPRLGSTADRVIVGTGGTGGTVARVTTSSGSTRLVVR